MKQILAAGAALAVLAAVPAYAACPADIDKARGDLRTNKGFQSRYTSGQIYSLAYRQLFEAARIFSDAGMEQRCQAVLSGIREFSRKTEARAPSTGKDRTAERGTPTDSRDRKRMAMLNGAKPFSATTVSAENLINADVRNLKDEDLGDVSDIV
ncbi:MAG: hypothetical protein KIT16_24060, partial [Rhodospirillaceae bacterium]|nr:hypothetical protein [Rhodospirillaceae bacterium]